MKSRIIHHGRRYTASAMRDGSLIIERNKPSKRQSRGQYMKPTHPQCGDWIRHLESETDSDIREAMCKAFLTD